MIVPWMPGPEKVPPVIGMMLRRPRGVSPTGIAWPSVTISSNANSRRGGCGSSCAAAGADARIAARPSAAVLRFAALLMKSPPVRGPFRAGLLDRQPDVVFRDAHLGGAARCD